MNNSDTTLNLLKTISPSAQKPKRIVTVIIVIAVAGALASVPKSGRSAPILFREGGYLKSSKRLTLFGKTILTYRLKKQPSPVEDQNSLVCYEITQKDKFPNEPKFRAMEYWLLTAGGDPIYGLEEFARSHQPLSRSEEAVEAAKKVNIGMNFGIFSLGSTLGDMSGWAATKGPCRIRVYIRGSADRQFSGHATKTGEKPWTRPLREKDLHRHFEEFEAYRCLSRDKETGTRFGKPFVKVNLASNNHIVHLSKFLRPKKRFI